MKRFIGRTILRLTGWTVKGERPAEPRYVLIAYPHTTSWDGFYMLAIAWALEMRISWLAKHTLFKPPFGWFMRWLGGIPVVRSERRNLVQQVADRFAEADELVVVVPPEGTRGETDRWKSGFYHIARTAGVPIVPGFLDYPRKQGGFGPPLFPTGEVTRDMDVLRAFYQGIEGKHHELTGPVRLREEEEEAPRPER